MITSNSNINSIDNKDFIIYDQFIQIISGKKMTDCVIHQINLLNWCPVGCDLFDTPALIRQVASLKKPAKYEKSK